MSRHAEIAALAIVLVCGSVLFVGQVLDGHVVRSVLWLLAILALSLFLWRDIRKPSR